MVHSIVRIRGTAAPLTHSVVKWIPSDLGPAGQEPAGPLGQEAAERVMRMDEARREHAAAGEADADRSVADAIGEALQEILRPLAAAPLPMRLVDALCDIEEADDWRWVRS